jgi:hypothetical protein
LNTQVLSHSERTTTAKNMGILKYHPTSLISYERGWPLGCLDDLIKPNQAFHQGARCFYAKSTCLGSNYINISTTAVWPWYRRSFQGISRGMWIIIAELTCGLFPMIFRMVFPSCLVFLFANKVSSTVCKFISTPGPVVHWSQKIWPTVAERFSMQCCHQKMTTFSKLKWGLLYRWPALSN